MQLDRKVRKLQDVALPAVQGGPNTTFSTIYLQLASLFHKFFYGLSHNQGRSNLESRWGQIGYPEQ